MVRINLLPVKQIKKVLKARNEIITFLMALLALAVVLLGLAFSRAVVVNDLNATIGELKKEKNSYQSTINEIEKLKKDKAMLETKLTMIKKLKKGSHITVRILDEIALLTPPNRMWLKSFVQTPGSLKLSGVALDNETIAQFMKQLKESPLFVDAELVNASLVVVAARKLKSFSLNCIVAPVKSDEPVAGEAAK
jgi:type IV pilus assembly protein PilN